MTLPVHSSGNSSGNSFGNSSGQPVHLLLTRLATPTLSLPLLVGSALSATALNVAALSAIAPSAMAQGIPLPVEPFETRAAPNNIAAKATQPRKSVWEALDVRDGGFKILMPGEVDRKVNRLQLGNKSVEQTLLLASQPKHDASYMVAWSDLSIGNNLSESEQAQILENTKQSFLNSFKGQLTQQIKFKLAGNNGMQYTMDSQVRGKPVTITSRSYLVGNRLYHVLAAIPKRVEPHLNGSTQGFLKSFQLRPIEQTVALDPLP